MAEEKNQKPVPSQEQSDLDVHSEYDKTEYNKKIKDYKKQATRSFVFAFTTLIAIIAVCIAWFVSNTRVSVTGVSISAEDSTPFQLASMGSRQDAEKNKLNLSPGTSSKEYSKYIDVYTGNEGTLGDNAEIYIGTSGLAWHLDGQESLMPGTSGKMEFYLIPKKEGLTSAIVKLNLIGYTENNEGKVEVLVDTKIQYLLNGHILFFQHLDDQQGYYGWIGEEQTIKLDAPEKNGADGVKEREFKIDTPYKVTLYWKWPQYFRNYIYTDRSTQGDLFTATNEERSKMKEFVNSQKNEDETNKSKIFYDISPVKIDAEISNAMNDATLDVCSKYYNQADEYIGKNVKYAYVQIQVDSSN